MGFSLNTPPYPPNIHGLADITTCSHRERDDCYADVVALMSPNWRIIICSQHLQWIIQKKESSRLGHWRARQYLTSRDSVIKACGKLGFLSNANTEAVLHALPEYVSKLTQE